MSPAGAGRSRAAVHAPAKGSQRKRPLRRPSTPSSFTPIRVVVTAGATVQFVNNGQERHTVAARDGSWSTEPLEPAMTGHVTLDAPGTFLYHCTEHRWAIGQITVAP